MASITPYLWYNKEAEEAARFYAAIIPDSRVDGIWTMAADSPSGPPGSVKVVDFTLAGRPFTAMGAGPLDSFNHAISLAIACDDQAEVDRIYDALLAGGSAEPCGWLKDRYGVSWQVFPKRLIELMADPDRDKARRVAEAMMTMIKIDSAALERAAAG